MKDGFVDILQHGKQTDLYLPKKDIIDIDETAYAARYIKYRGFRKCAV